MIKLSTALITLICSILLWVAVPTFAQTRTVLTLDEAQRLALEQSPLLHASQHDVAIAREDVHAANAARFPRVDAQESYIKSNNPTTVFGTLLNQGRFTEADLNVSKLVSPDALDNYRFGLSLNQPVYSGNRITLGVQRAELGFTISNAQVEETKQHVLHGVAHAFYDILLAKARVKTAKEAEEIALGNLRHIRARFEAGVVVKSDVLDAEVRLSAVREAAIVAERQVMVAAARLQHTIGLDQPVDAQGDLMLVNASLPSGTSDVREVLEARPDYQAQEMRVEQAAVGARLAKSRYLPSLDVESVYERNAAGPFSDNGESNYSIFAVFRLNLFNGLNDRANVRRSLAAANKQRQLLEVKRREIAVELEEARLAVEAARERIAVTGGAVEQAVENLRIVRNRYRSGHAPVIDLLTAELVLNQAKLSRLHAHYDLQIGLVGQALVQGWIGKGVSR